MASRPFTFDRVVRMLITLAVIAAAVWLIAALKNVLLPFCVAVLISYFLEPLVNCNRRVLRLKGRVIAVFVTLFEVATLVGILIYLITPTIIGEIGQMSELIRTYADRHGNIPFLPDEFHIFVKRNINLEKIASSLDDESVQSLLDKGVGVLSGSVDIVVRTVEWLLTFIYEVFIMLDYDRLTLGFKLLVPPKYRRRAFKVFDDIKFSMNRYFRGQALLALCAAVFYCIGFSIVGIPLALILGVCVGILYMIPYFQYITILPVFAVCVIYSLGSGVELWSLVWKCALVYVVSQCTCDYVLTPKIMGKALGLNPAIILLSLSIWGSLLGILGMIIALPLTTLCLAYYQEYVINRDGRDHSFPGNPLAPKLGTPKS